MRAAQPPGRAQPGPLRNQQPAGVRRGQHGVFPPRPELRLPPPRAVPLLQGTLWLGAARARHLRQDLRLPQRRQRFRQDAPGPVDPERVYEIDYLLAEANQNLVSRWGHSMLRLVICAPGRPRGPDCRLDLDQHLVLSYRAFVGDVQLSSWDGLVGKYPSRLFVLPLAQVIDEYTKTELRGLASVPLKLTRREIEDTVEHAAEMHWSYDGN